MACTITAACPGETKPASRASAVASCPESRSAASATWRAASERETVVVLATQASVPVNPASFAAPALSAAATSLSFSASSRRIARSTSDHPGVLAGSRSGTPRAPVDHPVQVRDTREHRVGAVGVEVEECCHGYYSFSNICSSQEENRNVDNENDQLMDSNHNGRVRRQ